MTAISNSDFLAGGGQMGALMRAFDWAGTPVGPPESWPQSLRVTIRLMLNTNHPMFIWWGPKLVQFYNDAYSATMGPEMHPAALGARGRDSWGDIWPIIGPQIEYVMAGKGATWNEDALVPITRHGKREDVWWTYGYSPIDVDGAIGGVLVVCSDVTDQHLAREALAEYSRRLERQFEQAPGFMAVLRGPTHIFELTNAAYRELVGGRDVLGKSVLEALPEVVDQGFIELLDEVYTSGKAHVGRRVPMSLEASDGERRDMYLDFVYQPTLDVAGNISGIFVQGSDITDHVRAETHLRLVNDELKHRVKNTLAMVSGHCHPDAPRQPRRPSAEGLPAAAFDLRQGARHSHRQRLGDGGNPCRARGGARIARHRSGTAQGGGAGGRARRQAGAVAVAGAP